MINIKKSRRGGVNNKGENKKGEPSKQSQNFIITLVLTFQLYHYNWN